MPVRRSSAKKSSPLSLAFVGSGETSAENVAALLDDFCDGSDPVFLFPVTKDHWNDNLAEVVGYAVEKDIPYDVVVDDSPPTRGPGAQAIKDAQKSHKIKKVNAKLVSLLADMENPKLITLWADDDEDCNAAADLAIDAQIEVLDLCNGLEEVEFEDEANSKEETEDNDDGGGEDDPYTEDELKELDVEALKEICKENGIDMPPPRSRASSYIKAILDFQEQEAADDEKKDAEPEDDEKPSRSRGKAEEKVSTNGASAEAASAYIGVVCPHCEGKVKIPLPIG